MTSAEQRVEEIWRSKQIRIPLKWNGNEELLMEDLAGSKVTVKHTNLID